MILMSKFGEWGRFGNQLFQTAFLNSMAKRYGTTYQIPKWKYSEYFVNEFNESDTLPTPDLKLNEPHYRYDQDFWDSHDFKTKTVDVLGYFQNEKYFSSPEEIKELFKFKPEIVEAVREKYKHLLTKPTIAVGVRRTDYLTSGQYHILSPAYYITALQKFDYKNCNIVFITDDRGWCYFHFKALNNAFFPQFDSDIEQFICGTLMTEGWITANSTFHFWSSYLSNAKRVIQPSQLFAGKLLEKEGNHNFYIENERFEIHDHDKIDLTDVTFVIPTAYDHQDRDDNLNLNLRVLLTDIKTNIIVGEQGGNKFEPIKRKAQYVQFDYPEFHRTRLINEMTKMATTPIVCNLDADCMVAPMQLFRAADMIRNNEADFVYPYQYLFVRVPKKRHNLPRYDLASVGDIKNGNDTESRPSVGGMVMYDRRRFLESGGENETFISYSPEDLERYERFTKLGLSCKRTRGHLYHLDHYKGVNSTTKNPFYDQGVKELTKIREMTKDQLRKYVDSWPWFTGYTDQYRIEISPTAQRSAQEVFKVLDEWGIKPKSVLDVGCGVGSWGVGLPDYTGVDFNVPREMTLVENHINHDLREPLTLNRKYDLVISVEVSEHLEERYADTIVDSICNHAAEYILFSAAIPFQGGVGHYNEQFQSYWAAKFEERGWYLHPTDIRQELYYNDNVDLWYRNNLMLFTKTERYPNYPINFVHPKYYEQITNHLKK